MDKKTNSNSGLIYHVTLSLLCAVLIIALVILGKPVVIPVIFAVLLGIVLRPVEKFFNQKLKIPRVIAILVTVILFMCLITSIVVFTTYELTRFTDDMPELKKNLAVHFHKFQHWASATLGIEYATQQQYITDAQAQAKTTNPATLAQKTVASLSALFSVAIVLPVLLFLVMYYRALFLNFLLKVFGEKNRACLTVIISDTKTTMQGYIAGLFMEMITVMAMQTLAMWIVGIKYFVFIGLITGVLNMIPYIGIMIAGGIGILIAMATGAETNQILFLIVGFAVVQFIDNNILLPKLVGHRVRINAFFSIVGVIAGGLICGVAGMFLAIPMMALAKVILENIDHLKPWGELMGDTMPKTVRWKHIHWPKMD